MGIEWDKHQCKRDDEQKQGEGISQETGNAEI